MRYFTWLRFEMRQEAGEETLCLCAIEKMAAILAFSRRLHSGE